VFDGLTAYDGALLLCALATCFAIAYFDARMCQIPAHLLLILAGLGIAWSIMQACIPMSLVPIGLGMGGLALVNSCWKRVIGSGDLLLFMALGLYIPIAILGEFLILCGAFGAVSCAILRKRTCPFAPAMVLAAVTALVLYMK
jgi:prepilin signal peptidase PulO-like enzyme (type II secretory pathway)